MADTFVKIANVAVGAGGAASITFSSIPSTYTDLKIMYSTRAASSGTDWVVISLGTGGTYTQRYLIGTGSVAGNGTGQFALNQNSTYTANTFSNGEIYIPNYLSSTAKSVSADSVTENNSSTANSAIGALIWSGTAAISNITLTTDNATNFAQYSTATLYGILKA